jgi:hypothetical protein
MSLIQFLNRLFKWLMGLLGIHEREDAPSPLQVLRMKNADISWVLPTTRTSGGPLDPLEIDRVELAISGDGGSNYSIFHTSSVSDPTSTTLTDIDPGSYLIRGVVIDVNGISSAGRVVAFDVADESPPEALTELTVSLS